MKFSKPLKSLLACLALLTILGESAGEFGDRPVEELPDSPERIIFDPVGDGILKTTITENVSQVPDGDNKLDPPMRIANILITATDLNQPEGSSSVPQTLLVTNKGVNDFPPVWDETSPLLSAVSETNIPVNDSGSYPYQREIKTLRVSDNDPDTIFTFTYEVRGCLNEDAEVCADMLNLIEIDDGNSGQGNTNGRIVLRRRLNVPIDREQTAFYGVETDFLNYTITVSDGINTASVDVDIEVMDINDNPPIWEKDFANPRPDVNEAVESGDIPIIKFQATDADKPDKFGAVSYIFKNDSIAQGIERNFKLDIETGDLTVIPGSFNWTAARSYTFVVIAIDNYQPGISSPSFSVEVVMNLDIVDTNDHRPEFMTAPGETVISIRETEVVPDEPLPGVSIDIRDQDNPDQDNNGVFSVEIIKIIRENTGEEVDPSVFRTGNLVVVDPVDNRKRIEIIATTKFTELKPLWGTYLVTFQAQDEGIPALGPVTADYRIKVINENLRTPVFEYPASENTSSILVSTFANALPNRPVMTFNGAQVDYIKANDDDDEENGNGLLTYFIEPTDDPSDGSAFFDIAEGAGSRWTLMLKASLVASQDVQFYTVALVARDTPYDPDEDSRSSSATLQIYLTPGVNRQPIFSDTTPQSVEIPENNSDFSVPLREAYDLDEGLIDLSPDLEELIGDQSISYTIIAGSVEDYNDLFEITKQEDSKVPMLKTKKALDREDNDQYELIVQVTNPDSDSILPDPRGTIKVIVNVGGEKDTPPQFSQPGIISGGISQKKEHESVAATVQ